MSALHFGLSLPLDNPRTIEVHPFGLSLSKPFERRVTALGQAQGERRR